MADITITAAEIGQVLSDAGAGLETAITNNLHTIATREACAIRQVLIQIKDDEGKNVLHYAAEGNRPNVIRLIVNEVLANDANTVEQLLGAVCGTGDTALMWAARYGSVESMMELYFAGAQDLGIRNHFGSTAIHIATSRGDIASLQALLDLGADIETANVAGETPLCLAARNDLLNAAQALINAQAALNQRDMYGQTPLHMAARHRHPLMVQLLLQAGADTGARDNNG